jgi:hypothetical protein
LFPFELSKFILHHDKKNVHLGSEL